MNLPINEAIYVTSHNLAIFCVTYLVYCLNKIPGANSQGVLFTTGLVERGCLENSLQQGKQVMRWFQSYFLFRKVNHWIDDQGGWVNPV